LSISGKKMGCKFTPIFTPLCKLLPLQCGNKQNAYTGLTPLAQRGKTANFRAGEE
jgi:hypothetical protein